MKEGSPIPQGCCAILHETAKITGIVIKGELSRKIKISSGRIIDMVPQRIKDKLGDNLDND